jgi:uncharacterized protein YebE (UPF0316 family)
MFTFLSAALLIFFLRLVGISFSTLRILMVMRGYKWKAWLFGFCQASIYLLALGSVLTQLDNWLVILGYAAGFATGIVVGMFLENRLAIGYTNIRIVSPSRGFETALGLREAGFAVTEVSARGRDGAVSILHCSVMRRYEQQIKALIHHLDPQAFITAENVYLIQHGFWY